ncbi:cation-transporting P-type ATPase [Haloarcula amylovorans]|uniref:cation-transporting P-type ATPase n=1 Tax=Haloarcula amylovorans TaxID=2562280 RepID=UPI001FD75EA7|nr:cation-transporting P-type ATPase [Halomicroarcula amylolytica]
MAVSASTDTESWYSRGLSQIYDSLDANSDGLSTEEAESRRSDYGPNRLPKAKPVTVWQIFLRQFKNPLIYILAIAAIVSFAIGDETDAGFIAVVLLVNTLVGGIQEWRAERSS